MYRGSLIAIANPVLKSPEPYNVESYTCLYRCIDIHNIRIIEHVHLCCCCEDPQLAQKRPDLSFKFAKKKLFWKVMKINPYFEQTPSPYAICAYNYSINFHLSNQVTSLFGEITNLISKLGLEVQTVICQWIFFSRNFSSRLRGWGLAAL